MRIVRTLFIVLMGTWLAACGSDGGDSDPQSPPPETTPIEVQLARQLQATGLEKNPQYFPVVTPQINEFAALVQLDQQIDLATAATYVTGRYVDTLNKLALRAQIGRAFVQVSSDLACTSLPVGGGVAADYLFVLDGKMLDVMAEVANGLVLREAGRTTLSLPEIVDAAAAQQLGFGLFCAPSDPLAFPDSLLSQAEFDRSLEVFAQLAGAIFFHEFAHVWNWHALGRIREQIFVPGGGFFAYTSVVEDNADIISGVLNAKSGHDSAYTKLGYDLMAFTFFYRKSPGAYSFVNTTSWQAQYQQLSPTYSPLATRKSLIDLGYRGWQSR